MNHLHPTVKRLLSLAVVSVLLGVQTASSQSTVSNKGNANPQAVNTLLTPITSGATSPEQKVVITVFPNPAAACITIQSSSPMHLVSIVDILGRTIKQVQPDQLQVQINLADILPGRYFINIRQQETDMPFIKSFVKV